MANGHRQGKATRTGAAGVDVENAVSFADSGTMRVARNYGMKAGGRWINVQVTDIVQDVDEDLANLQCFGFAQRRCPRALVIVATDRGNRCDPRKAVQYIRASYIARVNDDVAVPQCIERLDA